MKEVIGYVYKELKDNFVNTVCSEPTFRIDLDENGRVVVISYRTEECYKILGKPRTENKRKRLARNWASNKKMIYADDATWKNIRKRYFVEPKYVDVATWKNIRVEPKIEIKSNLKELADIAKKWVDKLDRLTDLIEETVSDSVYEVCVGAMDTFAAMAEELEKLSE